MASWKKRAKDSNNSNPVNHLMENVLQLEISEKDKVPPDSSNWTFTTLPDVIHDKILSLVGDPLDLVSFARVSKVLHCVASRFNGPLIIKDREEWTASQWSLMTHSLNCLYPNLRAIQFQRCNIPESAMVELFGSEMHVIDLRECRQIRNETDWLQRLDALNCQQVLFAKCSKLGPLCSFFSSTSCSYDTVRSVCIDRDVGIPTVSTFPNLETLAMINSDLFDSNGIDNNSKSKKSKYGGPRWTMLNLLRFPKLQNLFFGGSLMFHSKLQRCKLNITSIFRLLNLLEYRLKGLNDDTLSATDFTEKLNDNTTALVFEKVSDAILLFYRLHQRGLRVLELTFHHPDGFDFGTLNAEQGLNQKHEMFDGWTVAKFLFCHLMHSQFSDKMTILDFSSNPVSKSKSHGGFKQICTEFDHLRLVMEYVVDLAISTSGQTALHIASDAGTKHVDPQYVEALLAHNVWPNTRDRKGRTPLFLAAEHNHAEIARLLIQNGADIFKKRGTKETPLEIACMLSNLETVAVMLTAATIEEFNQNEKYCDKWSPVHCSVISRNREMLELLMKHGLDYAAPNQWKQTPLHICAVKNYVDLTRILLKEYSMKQLMLRDEYGITAQTAAEQSHNMEIAKLIATKMHQLRMNPKQHSNPNPVRRHRNEKEEMSNDHDTRIEMGNWRNRNNRKLHRNEVHSSNSPQQKDRKGLMSGVVKRFNMNKGFGFIGCDDQSPDVFVHFSEIKSQGFKTLRTGQRVQFKVEIQDDGRRRASNVFVMENGSGYSDQYGGDSRSRRGGFGTRNDRGPHRHRGNAPPRELGMRSPQMIRPRPSNDFK